jgi:hypothetical protein
VYDYVDGKADWMAYGLPVEGDDGPFLGPSVTDVPTCDVGLTVGDARAALDSAHAEVVIVTAGGGLAVGEVDADALEGRADDVALLEVLRPVPETVRPSVTVASVAGGGGGERLVTTSDGRLLGRATVGAPSQDQHGQDDHGHEDHEGHDHHGHDHLDMERYEVELTEVMTAIGEHFGDREPSAEELRAFLRDRLVAEGRSVEDAERFLDEMEAGGSD